MPEVGTYALAALSIVMSRPLVARGASRWRASPAEPSVGSMQRGPSIYDVAKVAGVAPSTVSRAISRPGRVNARTAELIFAAARAIGYRFDEPPRMINYRSASRSVAVVVPDVTNPF